MLASSRSADFKFRSVEPMVGRTMRKLTLIAMLCILVAVAPGSASAVTLRWPKPTLVNPVTVTLGTGYTHTALSATQDYIVKLPPTKKYGGTFLEGGHNMV